MKLPQEVILNDNDLEILYQFCSEFIDSDSRLDKSLTSFKNNGSFENQGLIIETLCELLSENKHSILQDSMWDSFREVSKKVIHELEFENFVETTFK